ncbi:hypothetical protein JGU66_27660 [Myxococcaceae bacterium JPH2]|nr:hypothetical protein [Myxococcaceae bacterium JPH2]
MSWEKTLWVWSISAVSTGAYAWWIIARDKRQREAYQRILTHGRRVKATLREVRTGEPGSRGMMPRTHVTFLVHEEGQGEDWLLSQHRFLYKPELLHLLVPGTVVDVIYPPEDREKSALIVQFGDDKRH